MASKIGGIKKKRLSMCSINGATDAALQARNRALLLATKPQAMDRRSVDPMKGADILGLSRLTH